MKFIYLYICTILLFSGCVTTEDQIQQVRQQTFEKTLPNISDGPAPLKKASYNYVYTAKKGNTGRGGAAMLYPGVIHVLDERESKEPDDNDIIPRELWESKSVLLSETSENPSVVDPAEIDESEVVDDKEIIEVEKNDIPDIFYKYCNGGEMTDEDWAEFYKAGGMIAIPEELVDSCVHQK
jgi:hypothetical protein